MKGTVWVAGVDGCRGGWFAAFVRVAPGSSKMKELRFALCRNFREILSLPEDPLILAVDIPIGLLDTARPGGRDCDREARRVLGRGRRSSVFTPPIRRALAARSYRQALSLNGRGISRQAFGILAKIREVDSELSAAQQRNVYEAHPELAFAELAGAPIQQNKKTRAGRELRECLLRRLYGRHYVKLGHLHARFKTGSVAADDVLDAYVLAYAAIRIAAGRASCLPSDNMTRDAKSLRMEIWY